MDNKYDSFSFKIKLNVNFDKEIEDFRALIPDPKKEDELDCSEEIRLKFDQINISKIFY